MRETKPTLPNGLRTTQIANVDKPKKMLREYERVNLWKVVEPDLGELESLPGASSPEPSPQVIPRQRVVKDTAVKPTGEDDRFGGYYKP